MQVQFSVRQGSSKTNTYANKFRLTWVPIVLTFSFSTKDHNANPYTNLYELLGPLDIKVLIEYEHGQTTHLVAKKRNTSKGLQALINGKYIVYNPSFVNALVASATPNEGGPAPLEVDFEANFPDPLRHLPPKGEEPTQRDETAYEPNTLRQDMFDGYTFVFYERRQYDTLLATITEGKGKASISEAIPNETTVDGFVEYVKNVAGEKGLGEFDDGSEGRGVVVVRFNPVKGAGANWFADFARKVQMRLDHRFVEQNEFLDAILGNDASVLRRPLEIELSGVMAPPPTAGESWCVVYSIFLLMNLATNLTSQTIQTSQLAPTTQTAEDMAPPEPPRRGRARRGARAKFTGFEDDFSVPVSSAPESMAVDEPTVESQSLFVSQNTEVDVDQETSQPPETQTRSSRKRPASPIIEEEEDIMEIMAPTTAALKRRRLERGEPTPPPPAPIVEEKPAPAKPAKKAKKEIDILEIARQRREGEKRAKAEREKIQEQLESMDIHERPEIEIAEMEVKRSVPPSRPAARADESERWDDKWNGRKNFKKFRRRGGATGPVQEKIIVPLEEVKKKDFGIGDDYWDDGDSQRRRKKDKGKGRETQDVSQRELDIQGRSSNKSQSRAAEKASRILASEAEDELGAGSVWAKGEQLSSDSDLEIVAPPPLPKKTVATSSRSQRTQTQTLIDKTNETQNLDLPSSNKSASAAGKGVKRVAEKVLTKPAPVKKARPTKLTKAVKDSDESDDDDGLKFRFKKR
jgi:nijmegen breakage syndrome protein 1